MARPDFTKKWASSRPSIPAISDPDYALGFANYLGAIPPSTDDHDYIMNLQDERAVWLGEQMLNAVGHEWQSDVTYDAYAVVRSPVNGQLYRSLVGSNLGNEPSVSGAQWAIGVQPLSTDFLNTTRIDVASAATVNLTSSAPNTRHINITGTTTITAFTVAAGQTYFVRFAGALTLTNNAGIVTQTGANITTADGDTCILRATAANVVEVLSYVSFSISGRSATTSTSDLAAGRLVKNGDKQVCTAWVNFNGTGTVAIRDSYNVSSITDNGAGQYTVNFTVNMANANYAVSGSTGFDSSSNNRVVMPVDAASVTVSGVAIITRSAGGVAADSSYNAVQIFGGK